MWSKHLILTMIQGDVEEFRRLLKNETEKNLSLFYKNHCADFNQREVRRVLEKAGAFWGDDVRVSLLHVAAATMNIEFLKLLIEAGCDVNTSNAHKKTILWIATISARVSESDDELRKIESLIKFLLDHGADVNYANYHGTTPLYWAAGMKNPTIARMLIAKGACVNERHESGGTPLLGATFAGSISVVKLLLDNDADIYITDSNGETPFTRATLRYDNNSFDVLKLLLERKGKCDKTSLYASKAWLSALSKCNLRTIKLLSDYGAHITQDSLKDFTKLHNAALNPHVEVMEYFLEDFDNDVNARCLQSYYTRNRTPLHMAAECGNEKGCKLLLSRGANVNCMDYFGRTPLYLAIKSRKKINRIVGNILIEHIAKSVLLNISVNEMDLEIIKEDYKMNCYYENCIKELKKMKIRKVYEDVSLFDILMKNDMASRYARNEDLIEALESAENQLNHDFPIYYSLLKEDLYKEIRKQRLLKGAAIVLNKILHFHDPFHLANFKILSYLKDEDLIRINETE